ncbi:coat F domain protein [Oxobacter pfennigii]|uniref:Coat F domain protein n=1 Tax=Oxobacter pfennigii TaxID=36849 RepID=A0A0P8Y7M3_9CLOT|nr:spore coat protein [Oxobacter pfennigii]KPU42511.1 coat F domain protein [Oxobacter pfennigii]
MNDKIMVNDALTSVKSSMTTYANVIAECSNPSLRSAIQQIRNSCEASQYELYKLAEQKGFYKPAQAADNQDVQEVKSQLGS